MGSSAATLNLYAEFATDNLEKPSNAETLEGFAHGAKIALMVLLLLGCLRRWPVKARRKFLQYFRKLQPMLIWPQSHIQKQSKRYCVRTSSCAKTRRVGIVI
tara:strand:+ start:272 stop:577 length:306 start_codon:yes stop_codon:yes gene_type:complete